MAGYFAEMQVKGFRPGTIALRRQLVAQLSRWLDAQHLGTADVTPERLEAFFALRRQRARVLHTSPQALRAFVALLDREGVLPRPVPSPPGRIDLVMDDYRRYLLRERGIAEAKARNYLDIARRFLGGLAGDETLDLDSVTAETVVRFVVATCVTFKPSTAKCVAVAMRSLLRYMHLSGLIREPLGQALPSPMAQRRLVCRGAFGLGTSMLLASCDAASPAGRRDRAILVLLARLGLRAGEVARLTVDDVDWREGRVRIRGKAGRVDVLPLPADVGEALEAYVLDGRPRRSGGLFRSVLAPHALWRRRR
jgi:site-specific recombinase XerD